MDIVKGSSVAICHGHAPAIDPSKLEHRSRSSALPPISIVGCRRILAVDDSPTLLAHLGRMLREDGHDVVFARSGREALDMLAAQTIASYFVASIEKDQAPMR